MCTNKKIHISVKYFANDNSYLEMHFKRQNLKVFIVEVHIGIVIFLINYENSSIKKNLGFICTGYGGTHL